MAASLVHTNLPGLRLVSQGKVRDLYATSDPSTLLFVATDRISAFDVILNNGIPDKGKLLTQMSLFWFERLSSVIPNHVVTASIDDMPREVQPFRDQLAGRTMLVKKATVVPLEAIVRGYLTGSAWAEYTKTGTVHGIRLAPGLVESQQLPEPLFTPSTKAAAGIHDENISPAQAVEIVGRELYDRIASTSLALYASACEHARDCGLILADTKFEFGTLPNGDLILVDEALTPDSSRYWPADGYAPGRPQPSFDKQFVRDWLKSKGYRIGLEAGVDGKGWTLDEEVVQGTRARYQEAFDRLTCGAQSLPSV